MSKNEQPIGAMNRFLNAVEAAGNKLPHITMLFIYALVIAMILSFLLSFISFDYKHPSTGETIRVLNMLSPKNLLDLVVSSVKNFMNFPPLAYIRNDRIEQIPIEQEILPKTAPRTHPDRFERGKQLESLLHRIEALAHHPIPRIALSATIGDEEGMKEELRPHRGDYPCRIVRDEAERHPLVQLRAYVEVPPFLRERIAEHGVEDLADDLFNLLSGGHHLVFANSRARTEQVATLLARRCRQFDMENEFFPHHGSLSRELRATLEARLQDPEKPTTAVCTSTLELGIDIGNMDSVVQIDAPNSVASLNQRLGRAGRRGGQQLLRICLLENFVLRNAGLSDRLHMGLFQSLAVLRLLQEGWCEPGEAARPHYSTLVQQILAVLGQYGGVCPSVLW